jgi:hypothetical protein
MIPILHHTAVTTADSTTAKADKSSKPTSSNAKVDASIFPAYSYKDYSPKATTIYTQHEQEANDLVDMLNGCVSVFRFENYWRDNIFSVDRPLGFDMEWRVIYRRGVGERRTALVQLSDERMILLIQISSMTSTPLNLIYLPYNLFQIRRVPSESQSERLFISMRLLLIKLKRSRKSSSHLISSSLEPTSIVGTLSNQACNI